jgi:hypothetical protein
MHRQGFDLRRTQYDERGWRATFYTTGMEHSPDERDRHRVGAHAVTRDARAAWEALRWARSVARDSVR